MIILNILTHSELTVYSNFRQVENLKMYTLHAATVLEFTSEHEYYVPYYTRSHVQIISN